VARAVESILLRGGCFATAKNSQKKGFARLDITQNVEKPLKPIQNKKTF